MAVSKTHLPDVAHGFYVLNGINWQQSFYGILDEIESDTWHILVVLFTHRRMMENIFSSGTRFDLENGCSYERIGSTLSKPPLLARGQANDAKFVKMLLKRGYF